MDNHNFQQQKENSQSLDLKGEVFINRKRRPFIKVLISLSIVLLILILLFVLRPLLLKHDTTRTEENAINPLYISGGNQAICLVTYAVLYEEADVKSPHVTEVLLNELVNIVDDTKRLFYGVKLADGTSGFVKKSEFTTNLFSLDPTNAVYKIVVRDPQKSIKSHAVGGTEIASAPMGAIFYADYYSDSLLRVKMPNTCQYGWLSDDGVFVAAPHGGFKVPQDFVKTISSVMLSFAKKPYVPSGQTTFGISPEGALRIGARINGRELMHRKEDLINSGREVKLPKSTSGVPSISFLKEGDVAFIGDGKGNIKTLAICLSDGYIVYAESGKSTMQYVSLTDEAAKKLSDDIMAVRRYD